MTPPTPTPHWRLAGGRLLTLDQPRVIAILNVTPDSFSDGGELDSLDRVVRRARDAQRAGAAMLDIGGESTRPGAHRVPSDEQIRRTAPAIRAIIGAGVDLPISIDTTRADVVAAALDAGAHAVNDVSGGTEDDAMLPLVAQRGCGVILMHRLRAPDKDRYSTQYDANDRPVYERGVVAEVREALDNAARRAQQAGVPRDAIVLDPGLGFGKTVEQNLALIRGTPELRTLGFPLLSGASRKSFLGKLAGVEQPADRDAASVAVTLRHDAARVRLFRVHDPARHLQALRVARALAEPE